MRQVIELAQNMIGKGDFAGASPFLDELEVRFEDEKDPAVEKFFNNLGSFNWFICKALQKLATKSSLLKQRVLSGFSRRNFPMIPRLLW